MFAHNEHDQDKFSVTSQEFCLASYVYWMTNCGYSFQQQYVRDMGDRLKVWVFVCDPGKKEERRKRDGGMEGEVEEEG